MKISTKGRYALRMLLELAAHQDDGFISLKEISEHQDISKKYLEQIRISKEVVHSRNHNPDIKKLVKGLMIESYLKSGCQKISDHMVYGQSITDPCLGWEESERLIYTLAELV